ncbi:IclR family transcriptional regulator [Rhizobium sp. 2MFCol3.1]|uniref:IclR family transcriptional regulator n=1 Tax=Rhizobium sp. 2MFCol3.1 TaxID=1246459 RepID=UPI00036A4352|nr:IclR family transcriptional regulator [Rhizobium sp. 2MFCol3.1]
MGQEDTQRVARRLEPADITSDKTSVVLEDEASGQAVDIQQDGDSPNEGVTIQSVDRALAVLEFIAHQRGPQRLQDIAASVGLKTPTCYHLVNTLVRRGYVARAPQSRAYYPGRRIGELARAVGANFDIAVDAGPHLKELANATGATSCIASMAGTSLEVTAYVEASSGVSLALYKEALAGAAHATALGKAILAWLPEPKIARVVAEHELGVFSPKTIDTLGDLVENLRQVRRHGFAVEDEEFRLGVVGLASAIRDHAGAVIGAIGCLMHVADADAARMRMAQIKVIATARKISSLYR